MQKNNSPFIREPMDPDFRADVARLAGWYHLQWFLHGAVPESLRMQARRCGVAPNTLYQHSSRAIRKCRRSQTTEA